MRLSFDAECDVTQRQKRCELHHIYYNLLKYKSLSRLSPMRRLRYY